MEALIPVLPIIGHAADWISTKIGLSRGMTETNTLPRLDMWKGIYVGAITALLLGMAYFDVHASLRLLVGLAGFATGIVPACINLSRINSK
jgi:hypothetical protein